MNQKWNENASEQHCSTFHNEQAEGTLVGLTGHRDSLLPNVTNQHELPCQRISQKLDRQFLSSKRQCIFCDEKAQTR